MLIRHVEFFSTPSVLILWVKTKDVWGIRETGEHRETQLKN